MFGSPNRGTKQPLCGWQEWDVSGPVRFTMLRLSRVQWDNGKCSFVNENVCTNAYDTNTIRRIQIYGGRTFWLLRLAPLKETLRFCREQSECRMKARQEWIDHHDTVETWKPSVVVIGLFTPCGLSYSLENLNQLYRRRRVRLKMQEYWRSQAYTDENRGSLLHLRRWDGVSLGASFYCTY